MCGSYHHGTHQASLQLKLVAQAVENQEPSSQVKNCNRLIYSVDWTQNVVSHVMTSEQHRCRIYCVKAKLKKLVLYLALKIARSMAIFISTGVGSSIKVGLEYVFYLLYS